MFNYFISIATHINTINIQIKIIFLIKKIHNKKQKLTCTVDASLKTYIVVYANRRSNLYVKSTSD